MKQVLHFTADDLPMKGFDCVCKQTIMPFSFTDVWCVCSIHHIWWNKYFIFSNLPDISLHFVHIVPFICGIIHISPFLVDCCIIIYHIVHKLVASMSCTNFISPNNTVDALLHYFDIVPFIWSNRPSLWRSRRLGPPLCFFRQLFLITWCSRLSKSTAVNH